MRAENQSFDCAEKLEKAADALSSMEKRAVMAESMLEATILSLETADSKAHGTARSTQDDRPQEGIYRSHSSPSPMYSSHSLISVHSSSSDHIYPQGVFETITCL